MSKKKAQNRVPKGPQSRIWPNRALCEDSKEYVTALCRLFNYRQVTPKLGAYAMTLALPREIDSALAISPKRDNQYADKKTLLTDLRRELSTPSLLEPTTATVIGLRGLSGAVVMSLVCPDYGSNRQEVTETTNGLLDIDHEWESGFAHLTVAVGNLGSVTNIKQIRGNLPSELHFGPTFVGWNEPF